MQGKIFVAEGIFGSVSTKEWMARYERKKKKKEKWKREKDKERRTRIGMKKEKTTCLMKGAHSMLSSEEEKGRPGWTPWLDSSRLLLLRGERTRQASRNIRSDLSRRLESWARRRRQWRMGFLAKKRSIPHIYLNISLMIHINLN